MYNKSNFLSPFTICMGLLQPCCDHTPWYSIQYTIMCHCLTQKSSYLCRSTPSPLPQSVHLYCLTYLPHTVCFVITKTLNIIYSVRVGYITITVTVCQFMDRKDIMFRNKSCFFLLSHTLVSLAQVPWSGTPPLFLFLVPDTFSKMMLFHHSSTSFPANDSDSFLILLASDHFLFFWSLWSTQWLWAIQK